MATAKQIEAAKEARKNKRVELDAVIETLANAVDAAAASEVLKRFLDVQRLFWNYSWSNQMMIAIQRPTATRVAGFKAWQRAGRFVRKGEKGIAIWAPITFKRTETDDAGNETEQMELRFRLVYVFDVEQTDGEPLPTALTAAHASGDDDGGALSSMIDFARRSGIAVTFETLPSGVWGESRKGTIALALGEDAVATAKTMAHELAHEILHQAGTRPGSKAVIELEAEAVAYVVGETLGLGGGEWSAQYIAAYGGRADLVRESLARIAAASRRILDGILGKAADDDEAAD